MEVVNNWYADAEQLLLRTRAAFGWRHSLKSRHTVCLYGDATDDEIKEAYRKANEKADDYCDEIHNEINSMEADAFALGKRFDTAWIDLFYLGLRNIEIKGLPAGRCALFPLQELVYKVRNWGRELTHANQKSRTLNCGEVCDFIDRERWVLNTVETIRERLLLERLTITEKLGFNSPVKPTGGEATKAETATVVDPTPESEANEKIKNLPNSQRLAYLATSYAETKEGHRLTDPEAWKYLNENGIEGAGELDDYDLPMQDTFADYMNRARRALDEKKYSPRSGRTGGSVTKVSDL